MPLDSKFTNSLSLYKKSETMKTVVLTPSSSTISSTASSAVDGGERSDSCYFPGCRRDANCKCEICQASINATLDLVPSTARSKISNPNPKKPQIKTPISFDPRVLSTPKLKNPRSTSSPLLNSTARVSFRDKAKREKISLGFGGCLIRLILVLGLALGVDLWFSWGISRVLKPDLSVEMVQNVTEKARVLQDLDGKLGFLQRELQGLVNGEVSGCGSNGSLWKVNKNDLLLSSQCTLYKSAAEEVIIWGWPLQTAGLLTAGFSSRSLSILSGRVTEWSNGHINNFFIKTNQSWLHQKWSASAVQLEKNTWIIEYKQALMIENSRIISAAFEFLKFRLSREIIRFKQELWFSPDFGSLYSGDINGDNLKVPT